MRSLIIVAALLALALPTTVFALNNICPEGNIGSPSSSYFIGTIDPGEEYAAVGCNIYGEVSLNGQGVPSSGSAPISIKVEDSAIDGYLQIWFPNEVNDLATAPFYVTIQNNVFQNDARIAFFLSLPPHSWITFQGNQMNGNATQYWPVGLTSILVQVSFSQNTTVNIIDNTLSFNKNEPRDTHYPISVLGSTATDNCDVVFNILRNTIISNGTNSVNLILINSWNTGDNSTLRIESNTMTVTNNLNEARALRIISITGGSFSFSNNVVELFSNNNIISVIYLSNLQTGSLCIDHNAITTNAPYFIHGSDVSQYASMSGNTFNLAFEPITTPVILIEKYNFINATLVVASNNVTAPLIVTTNVPLLYIINPVIEGTASIVHCGNSLPWAATPEKLFSSSVGGILVL